MAIKTDKTRRPQVTGARRKGRSRRVKLVVLAAVACGLVLAGYYFIRPENGADRSGAPAVGTMPAASQTGAENRSRDFHALIGRWRRPDGGYVIEIRGIDAAGKMDVGYFNPRPINVARATAAKDAETLKVFIELQDVGYPGATYTLAYDPGQNVLKGLYYQPAAGQTFDVVFVPLQ
ncbi:MAG: hypothetical protein WCD88_13430 [Desulfobacterales bacterium]